MNAKHIESRFAAMGARLKVREIASRWQMGNRKWIDPVNYAVDIRRDRDGEFFELRVPTHLSETVETTVLQSEPKQRHLLLLIRKTDEKPQLDRFLCGHDEREWFVAAVPGGASSVRQAMDALQPKNVRDALARDRVSSRKRYKRKNRAFRRQGRMVLRARAVPGGGQQTCPLQRTAPSWRGQTACRGAALPHRRRDSPRMREASERHFRKGIRRAAAREPEGR